MKKKKTAGKNKKSISRNKRKDYKKTPFSGVLIMVSLLIMILLFLGYLINSKNTPAKKENKNRVEAAKSTNIKNIITETPTPFTKNTTNNSQNKNNVTLDSPLANSFCLRVPVLMYHHVEPYGEAKKEGHASLTVDSATFDQQMKYLTEKGYRTISGDDLANALSAHQKIEGKPILITIDDGYSDAYNYAFPTAKKYNIVLNLMIPTGLIGNPGYMSWGNLKEMVGSGLVSAYDHTWSHYSLPRGDDAKDQMEIMTAKKQLEENLGKTVKIFAYPYGSSDQRIVNLLQKNGFIAAFSTISSTYQCDNYIFALRRTRIGNASLSYYGL